MVLDDLDEKALAMLAGKSFVAVGFAKFVDQDGYPDLIQCPILQLLQAMCLQLLKEGVARDGLLQVEVDGYHVESIEGLNDHDE